MSRFHIPYIPELDPRGLRLLDGFGELGPWAHHRVELLPDLAENGARPAGAHLSLIDQLFGFSLAEIRAATPVGSFANPMTGNFSRWTVLILNQALVLSDL
jgi:hypothetical protein